MLRVAGLALALALTAPNAFSQVTLRVSAWRFCPDSDDAGVAQEWFAPAHNDAAWETLQSVARWEDQGYPELDGVAWYRCAVDVPAAWEGRPAWLVLGGVNDAATVYCNGREVNSYGDNSEHSMAAMPIIADLGVFVRCGQPNVIAVRVLDWGGSGGLWREPCVLTTDRAALPLDAVFSCFTDYEAEKVVAQLDLAPLGNDIARARATVRAEAAGGAWSAGQEVHVGGGMASRHIVLPVPEVAPGQELHIALAADAGPLAALVPEATLHWPGPRQWPGEYSGLKVLNNFVTKLLHADEAPANFRYEFLNPRDGWVFVSVKADTAPETYFDSEEDAFVWRTNPDTGAHEIMWWLPEGMHVIESLNEGPVWLDVRAVPELAYCYYLANPHVAAQGPYDRAFLDRWVLPHVNTLVASGNPPEEDFEAWRAEHRHWLANASLPGLSSAAAPTADEVYAVWAENPAVQQFGYRGLIVDEFLWSSAEHYAAWTEATKRVYDTPAFMGQTFYAWCGDIWEVPQGLAYSRMLAGLGGRFVIEEYLAESPTEDAARADIRDSFQRSFAEWRAVQPDVQPRVVMCPGYMSAPTESLNTNPGVDYNVFLDMQMHTLATEPDLWQLYGVMWYSASYADEEAVRWAYRLCRHYCIDGARERLNTDPYLLPHVVNPDFADGLDGWTAEPAAPGSIAIDNMDGFSFLQSRYPRTTQGDQYLAITRSAAAPNRVRQTVKGLTPGRLYSVKLYAADIEHLHDKQTVDVAITLDGAERIDALCFHEAFPSCYSHIVGPYTRENPAWFTYYRLVFRATGESAELTISDWTGDGETGGAEGQRVAMNFVEVQPYWGK